MIFAGALTGGLYNEWLDARDKARKREAGQEYTERPELPGNWKYLKYLAR